MRTLLQFGAGNIGRSFIGQVFARGGYRVVFVDLESRLIEALNREGAYRVIVKHPDANEETLWVRNVSALDGRDSAAVAEAVATVDLAAISVGPRALPNVLETLAAGLARRAERTPGRPLDVILAENLHAAADFCRARIPAALHDTVGLVETSIGKMVPLMRPEDLARDPLWVFAEPYNELIVDARGFRGPIPDVPDLRPVEPIDAWVDRKLCIHNLGHSAAAFRAHEVEPHVHLMADAMQVPGVMEFARSAMLESAAALEAEYPNAFTMEALSEHIDDLLLRFANPALGDTVFRVGRDLPRKLGRADRFVGAMLLCARRALSFAAIARAYVAAARSRLIDDQGTPFEPDRAVWALFDGGITAATVAAVSDLNPAQPLDATVIEGIRAATSD